MYILKVERREINSKGKQLRREGVIPAVLYGKHLDESVIVQLSQREAEQFLKSNAVGSKLELKIGNEKHLALLKEVARTPGTGKIEHLSFQALKEGEKVKSVARIVLTDKEKVEGLVLQTLDEVSYRAVPSHIVDRVEVSVKGLSVGDNLSVADLEFSKNEDLEILTPLDSIVVTVSARKEHIEETEPEANEPEAAEAGDAAEE